MKMKTLLVTLSIMAVAVSADVSHLSSRYLPPNYRMQQNQHGLMMTQHKQQPSNERVKTTIEQHEVIELPTQIEIVKAGQPIYGVHRQSIEMARTANNMPDVLNSHFVPPSQKIQNLQPTQGPYDEMPMREYLPPNQESITTDLPTTTIMPPVTTYNPMMFSSNAGEVTTEVNNYDAQTTEMPTKKLTYETSTAMPTMPEKQYLPPMSMPQTRYLPPRGMNVMLPPMPQPTYQQYQEQMKRQELMQQMYRVQKMQELMNAIAEMEQQQMIALEPQPQQMQPVAPVEPGHILKNDGYHYKTAANDLRRFRYRH